jgi:oligo-1,6-glucosidase
MRREVLNDYDVLTVGECIGADVEDAVQYANLDGTELNMLIHFALVELDHGPGGKWDIQPLRASALRDCITRWQEGLDGRAWVANYLCNHDQPRSVSRFGNDGEYRNESAKMLAVLNVCQRGTPFIFAGEEIGMTNVAFPSIDDYRDVESLNYYRAGRARGEDPARLLESIHVMSRDNGRTPMQWSSDPNGGFTTGTPWIGVNPNHDRINVAAEEEDSDSILHFYRRLLALRKEHDALMYGSFQYRAAGGQEDGTFAFDRRVGGEAVLIVLNLTGRRAAGYPAPESAHLLLSNYGLSSDEGPEAAELRPFEARIYALF